MRKLIIGLTVTKTKCDAENNSIPVREPVLEIVGPVLSIGASGKSVK